MKIIKKEKDREVSFLIEDVNPALYKMVFNPDYFEALGLKQVYGAAGGGTSEEEGGTYPYKFFHVLYDWMFTTKKKAPSVEMVASDNFQYPENRMSLEALAQNSKSPKIELRPYELREAPVEEPPQPPTTPEPPHPTTPESRPETIMQELTESHPYGIRTEEDAAEPKPKPDHEESPLPTATPELDHEAPLPLPPAPTTELIFTFHKIGLVHPYGEYNEMKKRQTTDADIEHDDDGKTKQETLEEAHDAEVQAYFKLPLLKMEEKPEVQEAKSAEMAFTGEKIFMIRTNGGKTVMLDWRLFPPKSGSSAAATGFFI